ncbi:MAG: dihydrofolate reductase family protein [Humibacillus sp.]
MARLVYTTLCSVDGYSADADGRFDWAAPDDEVHAFINDVERDVGTYLLGRRIHEVMVFWDTAPTRAPDGSAGSVGHDYARVWRAADKIVYSRTLAALSAPRTVLEHDFNPAAVARMVAVAESDVSIGGAHLAAEALRAGIVDEVRLLRVPVVVGGGTPVLPEGVRFDAVLLDSRSFAGGATWTRYAVRR